MGKYSRPRRGSLQFIPKSRAKSETARIRTWPAKEGAKLLGFAGYKVGQTHVLYTENNPHLGRKVGQEKRMAVTVLEVPPMKAVGYRLYKNEMVLGEVLASELPKELSRKIKLPGKKEKNKNKIKPKTIDEWKKEATSIRLILSTQPILAGLPKKKPEIMEVGLQGNPEEQLKIAEEFSGKEIKIGEVFNKGEIIDVLSITTGKGFQGAVKRHGVKILSHKAKRGRREQATNGSWIPKRTDWKTPMSGQMGYNQRCEYNKRILLMESNGLNPTEGGWQGYGKLNGDYILISGSVPGPTKRLIRMRFPVRPPRHVFDVPELNYLNVKGDSK